MFNQSKNKAKNLRNRSGFVNKSMLSVEALENRRMLAADFMTVMDGGQIFVEARGTEFQDRFTVEESGHDIKIRIDFEIDAKGDGEGDFGQFSSNASGNGTAADLKELTFAPGTAAAGANTGGIDPVTGDPDPTSPDAVFFDSIEASYNLDLLEFQAVLNGTTFGGVRVNGATGTTDNDFIDLSGLRNYDDGQFTLNGGGGNDIIKGGLQGDIINGGANNDQIFLADNEDTIDGGGGNGDSVRYGAHSFGAEADDITGGVEFVRGTNFHDEIDLSNNNADVTIIGLGGQDTLTGGGGDDIIIGDADAGGSGVTVTVVHDDISVDDAEADHDIINGNGGNDRLYGNAGNDQIEGGAGNDDLFGQAGRDHLSGGANNDELFGGDDGDKLDGGTGNDDLDGGAGDDLLLAGAGTDDLVGGAGTDTADFSAATGAVDVDLDAGDVNADGFGFSGDISTVENVLGSATAANTLTGNGSANILVGGEAADVINGGAGDDLLIGRGGDDEIGTDKTSREAGNDTILGGAGADTLRGGEDDDRIVGDGDLTVVRTGTAFPVTKIDPNTPATKSFDEVFLNTSEPTIVGPEGDDIIEGDGYLDADGDGDFDLHLDSGNDVINGNGGDDTIYASDALDPFDGDGLNAAAASSADTIDGDNGDDDLFGHAGVDLLFGDRDNTGDLGGDDVLFGLLGEDQLFGGNGSDFLVGGGGADILVGGTGSTFDGNDILQIEAVGAGAGAVLVDDIADGGTGSDRFRITGADGTSEVSPDPLTRSTLQTALGNDIGISSDFDSGVFDDIDFVSEDSDDVSNPTAPGGAADGVDDFGDPLFIDLLTPRTV